MNKKINRKKQVNKCRKPSIPTKFTINSALFPPPPPPHFTTTIHLFLFSSSLSLCVSKKSGLTWKSATAKMAEEGNGKIFLTMFWVTFSPSYASSIPSATCPRFAILGMQPALIPFSGKRWNWIYIIASLSNQICLLPGWLGLIILLAWTTFSSRLWLSTVVIWLNYYFLPELPSMIST